MGARVQSFMRFFFSIALSAFTFVFAPCHAKVLLTLETSMAFTDKDILVFEDPTQQATVQDVYKQQDKFVKPEYLIPLAKLSAVQFLIVCHPPYPPCVLLTIMVSIGLKNRMNAISSTRVPSPMRSLFLGWARYRATAPEAAMRFAYRGSTAAQVVECSQAFEALLGTCLPMRETARKVVPSDVGTGSTGLWQRHECQLHRAVGAMVFWC